MLPFLAIISSLLINRSLSKDANEDLTADDGNILYGGKTKNIIRPRKLNGMKAQFLWPKGVVYYDDSSLSRKDRSLIRSSLDDIERRTSQCVTFKQTTRRGNNIIKVSTNRKGCSADLGYSRTHKRKLNLGNGCMSERLIKHEFFHALGVNHTIRRGDRDAYVKINKDNIISGVYKNNFSKIDRRTYDDHKLPYDYDSIVHYQWKEFAKNLARATIEVKKDKSKRKTIGTMSEISDGDVDLIRHMYGCLEKGEKCDQDGDCKGSNKCRNGVCGGGTARTTTRKPTSTSNGCIITTASACKRLAKSRRYKIGHPDNKNSFDNFYTVKGCFIAVYGKTTVAFFGKKGTLDKMSQKQLPHPWKRLDNCSGGKLTTSTSQSTTKKPRRRPGSGNSSECKCEPRDDRMCNNWGSCKLYKGTASYKVDGCCINQIKNKNYCYSRKACGN